MPSACVTGPLRPDARVAWPVLPGLVALAYIGIATCAATLVVKETRTPIAGDYHASFTWTS